MAVRGFIIPVSAAVRGLTMPVSAALRRLNTKLHSSVSRLSSTDSSSTNGLLSFKRFLKTLAIGGLGFCVYIGHSYIDYDKYEGIRKKLENGTRPSLPLNFDAHEIRRPEEEEVIKEILLNKRTRSYGVILGPTGTGKSCLTMKVCSKYPSRVIYNHITVNGALPLQLANAINMKLRSTFIDQLMAKILPGYESNFVLPETFEESLDFVLNIINLQAQQLLKICDKKVVTLVLDGVDLIAKQSREDFITLIDLCKNLADKGNVNVILVSSEERIVSLMKQTSSRSRSGNIVEILDLSKDVAVKYLKKFNVPNPEDIYHITGGRMIYLIQCIQLVNFLSSTTTLKSEEIFETVGKEIIGRNVYPAIEAFVRLNHQLKYTIMKRMLSKNEVNVEDLRVSCCGDGEFYEVLQKLVNGNILRYTSKQTVTWHNAIIKNYLHEHPELMVKKA